MSHNGYFILLCSISHVHPLIWRKSQKVGCIRFFDVVNYSKFCQDQTTICWDEHGLRTDFHCSRCSRKYNLCIDFSSNSEMNCYHRAVKKKNFSFLNRNFSFSWNNFSHLLVLSYRMFGNPLKKMSLSLYQNVLWLSVENMPTIGTGKFNLFLEWNKGIPFSYFA